MGTVGIGEVISCGILGMLCIQFLINTELLFFAQLHNYLNVFAAIAKVSCKQDFGSLLA